jgi:hypothetical protein
MLTAASTAKAKRRAADSPPTRSSRRPATSLASDAARRSSTGAVRSKELEVVCSAERARAVSPANSSMSQARTDPGPSGTTQE